jgi:hypothetical protein
MAASGSGPTRKMTAIATIGDQGQAYTVYENNWLCPDCSNENYANRSRCYRCRAPKPDGGGGLAEVSHRFNILNGQFICAALGFSKLNFLSLGSINRRKF